MMPAADVYDVVAYPGFPYVDTHPSRLATMAMLHGLEPVPVERCRVLEVGCNAGANLIPMAYALPHSEFVGFDLAADPIGQGQRRIGELGLANIRLVQADILDAEQVLELAGRFDYIIAHGVYAWVPAEVRDRLLRFCREHLSPQGVAFLSYAALPGGHLRLLSRDLLRFRGAKPDHAADDVRESIRFVKFIALCRPEGDGFRTLLEKEIRTMERRGPEVVFHDEMASTYEPVSFTQFATHAAEHGLRYFSEAELPSPKDPCFHAEIAAKIRELAGGDPLAQEQMLDFARMRKYRESLLCPAEASFTHDLQAGALQRLFMTSQAQSAEGSAAGSRTYTLPGGLQIETQHPATVALLEHLIGCSPEAIGFAEVSAKLEEKGLLNEPELLMLILRLVVSRMIDVHAWRAPVRREIADRPQASRLCRMEALGGTPVVTLLHKVLSMNDPITQQLLPLLDGTRSHDDLLRDLSEALPDTKREVLAAGLAPALEALNRAGVLETASARLA